MHRDVEATDLVLIIIIIIKGILTMYLDRETYERAGLVGRPHGVKGKRSGKPRWGKFFFVCLYFLRSSHHTAILR